MAFSVNGVSGGSAGEAWTAGTMYNYHGAVTINNIVIVQKDTENNEEFLVGIRDLLSTLPGDSRLLMLQQTTVLLFGKTGVGKSSVGNILLGRKAFSYGGSCVSVTNTIQSAKSDDGSLRIIDTPGLLHTHLPTAGIIQELQRELIKSDVHALMLVMKIRCRFTKEDETTLDIYKRIFGEDATRHIMVVFTGKDYIDACKVSLKECIRQSHQYLRQLLKDYGNRYMAVNSSCDEEERQPVRLRLIEQANGIKRSCGGKHLTIPVFVPPE